MHPAPILAKSFAVSFGVASFAAETPDGALELRLADVIALAGGLFQRFPVEGEHGRLTPFTLSVSFHQFISRGTHGNP
jgi:hypothetical protein